MLCCFSAQQPPSKNRTRGMPYGARSPSARLHGPHCCLQPGLACNEMSSQHNDDMHCQGWLHRRGSFETHGCGAPSLHAPSYRRPLASSRRGCAAKRSNSMVQHQSGHTHTIARGPIPHPNNTKHGMAAIHRKAPMPDFGLDVQRTHEISLGVGRRQTSILPSGGAPPIVTPAALKRPIMAETAQLPGSYRTIARHGSLSAGVGAGGTEGRNGLKMFHSL